MNLFFLNIGATNRRHVQYLMSGTLSGQKPILEARLNFNIVYTVLQRMSRKIIISKILVLNMIYILYDIDQISSIIVVCCCFLFFHEKGEHYCQTKIFAFRFISWGWNKGL